MASMRKYGDKWQARIQRRDQPSACSRIGSAGIFVAQSVDC